MGWWLDWWSVAGEVEEQGQSLVLVEFRDLTRLGHRLQRCGEARLCLFCPSLYTQTPPRDLEHSSSANVWRNWLVNRCFCVNLFFSLSSYPYCSCYRFIYGSPIFYVVQMKLCRTGNRSENLVVFFVPRRDLGLLGFCSWRAGGIFRAKNPCNHSSTHFCWASFLPWKRDSCNTEMRIDVPYFFMWQLGTPFLTKLTQLLETHSDRLYASTSSWKILISKSIDFQAPWNENGLNT